MIQSILICIENVSIISKDMVWRSNLMVWQNSIDPYILAIRVNTAFHMRYDSLCPALSADYRNLHRKICWTYEAEWMHQLNVLAYVSNEMGHFQCYPSDAYSVVGSTESNGNYFQTSIHWCLGLPNRPEQSKLTHPIWGDSSTSSWSGGRPATEAGQAQF